MKSIHYDDDLKRISSSTTVAACCNVITRLQIPGTIVEDKVHAACIQVGCQGSTKQLVFRANVTSIAFNAAVKTAAGSAYPFIPHPLTLVGMIAARPIVHCQYCAVI
jgi:hypothetical protein